ncbi:MAG: hypothetical protein WA117_15585, partial [Verrucomicrobiia bacterium]
MRTIPFICLLVTMPLIASAAPPKPSAKPAAASASSLVDLVREFEADDNGVSSFYDLPRSAARFDRLETLYAGWQTRLAAVDFDALNPAGRVDYLLLR